MVRRQSDGVHCKPFALINVVDCLADSTFYSLNSSTLVTVAKTIKNTVLPLSAGSQCLEVPLEYRLSSIVQYMQSNRLPSVLT